MISNRKILLILRILSDIVLIISGFFYVGSLIEYNSPVSFKNNHWFLLICLVAVWYFSTRSTGLYKDSHSRTFSYELVILIKNIIIQILAAIVILFFSGEFIFSRSFILLYAGLVFLLISTEKYIVRKILIHLRKKGRNLRNVLIIGAGEIGMDFYKAIKNNIRLGYNVIGFLDDEKKAYLNGEYLGKVEDLNFIIKDKPVDSVIIALPVSAERKIKEVIRICGVYAKRVKIIPDYFRFFASNNLSIIEKFPVLSFREEKLNEIHYIAIKRIFDILVSLAFILAVSWWLFPLIAICIKLDSPGPVLFKQERWGKDDKKFFTYKFRSMVYPNSDTDKKGNYIQTVRDDPRITSLGRILRKASLDELPQFWNVLKGEMTIVGPRPHPTPLNIESRNKIEHYTFRHLVKPGITGWAQVNGFRGDTKGNGSGSMKERIEHDLWYIENWSFWLDIEIILLTIIQILKGDPNAF
jgi:putative colanic acid biosynthesis UDP-glucose lipid carrier transferase